MGTIIWLTINHSLTTTKTLSSVPVRIINLPEGMTIEGMQSNQRLSKKLDLILIGNINMLDTLNASDIEVVIDASHKTGQWEAIISKKNLLSLNTELDIAKGISKVYHPNIPLKMTKLVTETIPVTITRPIGESPRGYQFLDIWPYQTPLTITGPEDVIRRLRAKEQKITFNLNDISKTQLDQIVSAGKSSSKDHVVSFLVPQQWKQIHIPLLSDSPLLLDDTPNEPILINFLRCDLLPLDSSVLISLFYLPEYSAIYNPSSLHILANDLIGENHGLFTIKIPLYAQGVDRLFTQIIKNRILISITPLPLAQTHALDWEILFINPTRLEEEYVSTLMSDDSDEHTQTMNPRMKEEYLRNRFRSYMNRFRLYTAEGKKFSLTAKVNNSSIDIRQSGE
ncbi:MAG: hypothetical protein FJZ58_00180 [Chlamydiae bacterium]|nr:hypothetical protein [Chlamydiota bacterium]